MIFGGDLGETVIFRQYLPNDRFCTGTGVQVLYFVLWSILKIWKYYLWCTIWREEVDHVWTSRCDATFSRLRNKIDFLLFVLTRRCDATTFSRQINKIDFFCAVNNAP